MSRCHDPMWILAKVPLLLSTTSAITTPATTAESTIQKDQQMQAYLPRFFWLVRVSQWFLGRICQLDVSSSFLQEVVEAGLWDAG